jgi:hypothetical protein
VGGLAIGGPFSVVSFPVLSQKAEEKVSATRSGNPLKEWDRHLIAAVFCGFRDYQLGASLLFQTENR